MVADRKADWEAHLLAIKNILPIFREFESINYLRYGSLYPENMRILPKEHQEIYRKSIQGHFEVKQRNVSLNAVP